MSINLDPDIESKQDYECNCKTKVDTGCVCSENKLFKALLTKLLYQLSGWSDFSEPVLT